MERGLLMPSQQLLLSPLLMLIPGMPMAMVLDTMDMDMVSAMDTMVAIEDTMVAMPGHMDTGERRKDQLMPSLMPSLLLMLMLGTVPMDMAGHTMLDTEDTTGVDYPTQEIRSFLS